MADHEKQGSMRRGRDLYDEMHTAEGRQSARDQRSAGTLAAGRDLYDKHHPRPKDADQ
ncbi:hypothetical protein ACTJI8_02865 [Microbacterium sp. 22303]|uniref:hypothetical protein n=1 Tax=Microbacterium sp. 22303 TaxID=3453905 RepID=UPI003F84D724